MLGQYRGSGYSLLIAFCLGGVFTRAESQVTTTIFAHAPEIRSLSAEQAARHKPVHLKGVVTALSGWRNSFFVQESGIGISVDRTDHEIVRPGDEVDIEGVTGEGLFAPIILANRVRILGHRMLPPAVPANLSDLVGGGMDSQRVEMRGVVHSAQVVESWGRQVLRILLDIGGDIVTVHVHDFPKAGLERLIDSEIRVTGVCGSQFNDRKQFVGLRLFVPDYKDLEILKGAPSNPFSRPESSLSSLFRFGSGGALRHQVKVAGTVTYSRDGEFYIQAAEAGLLVQTSEQLPAIGERVEAVGFLSPGEYSPVMSYASIRNGGGNSPVAPTVVGAADLIQVHNGFVSTPFDGRLVQVDARLVERVRNSAEEVWILSEGNTAFQALMPLSLAHTVSAQARAGARVRVIGVCAVEANQTHEPTDFHLLLRQPKDILVLSVPWWTLATSLTTIVILVFLCLGLLAWIVGARIRRHDGGERSASVDKVHLLCRATAEWFGLTAAVTGLVFALYTRFTLSISASMAPFTAIALVLLGLALYAHHWAMMAHRARWLVKVFSASSLFLAVTMLVDRIEPFYQTSGRFWLVKAIVYQRMAWPSVIITILLSLCCLLNTSRRAILLRQVLALLAGTIALLNTVAYLFGIKDLFWLAPGANMAIFTSVAFILLSLGICLATPDVGLMAPLMSSGLSGSMGRRLLPAALLVPMALGWVSWQGQIHSVFNAGVCMALFVLACILVFTFLISVNVGALERMQHLKRLVSDELYDSEERFRDTFEQAAVGIAHVTPDGRFVRVNKKLCSIIGYSAVELKNKLFDEITHEADLDEDRQNAQSLLKGTAHTYTMDKRYYHKDGSLIWVRLTVSLVWREFGEPDYFIAIIQDINDGKTGDPQFEFKHQSPLTTRGSH